MFPLYTVEQLEYIWTQNRSDKSLWKTELGRRKHLVKLIWGICKGPGSLVIEAWTAARAALLLHRFYTVNPNCDGPGWAVAAAAVLLACKIDGVNKSVQDVTKATLYYRIKHDPQVKGQSVLLDDKVETSAVKLANDMDTVRMVEMDLLCSLAFHLEVDVPYMDLTRLFRTAGLLQCAAEHSELLGNQPKNQPKPEPSGAEAGPSSSSAAAAADSVTTAAAASKNNSAECLEEKDRGRLMQLALNFVKDSSETVAPLMFEVRELALAALYMSCNLLIASKRPVNSITMDQALSVPDGKTFYSYFAIAEERLNAVVNFLKTMYPQQTAATMSTPSQMPGQQQAAAGSSSGGQSQQQQQGKQTVQGKADAGEPSEAAAGAGAVAGADSTAMVEARAAAAGGEAAASQVKTEGCQLDGEETMRPGRKVGSEQEQQQPDAKLGAIGEPAGTSRGLLEKEASESLADGEALVKHEPVADAGTEEKLAASSDAAPKHLKRSRRCAESTGDEDEVLNGAAPDHEDPAAKRVAAGASVEVN